MKGVEAQHFFDDFKRVGALIKERRLLQEHRSTGSLTEDFSSSSHSLFKAVEYLERR